MTRTRAQEMMIEDGLPAAAVLDPDERRASWRGVKLTRPRDPRVLRKEEDQATRALRKELAAAGEKRKAERFARLRELKEQHKPKEASMAKKKLPNTHPAVRGAKKIRAGIKRLGTKAARRAKSQPARKAAKAPKPKADVVGMITQMMMTSPGATMGEMVKAAGIDPHPMRAKIKRARELLGIGVDHPAYSGPSKENGARYAINPDKLPKPAAPE